MKFSHLNSTLIGLVFFLSFSAYGMTETISQSESDAARILMLEKALAPKDPEEVAALFAKANKERNGAVQFMLFSDSLKSEFKNNWPYWVSGTSSPWITSYAIKKMAQTKTSCEFLITYQWATASGPFQPPLTQKITIEPVPKTADSSQEWWITSFNED
ncbi:hypothetical protein [Legionella hackeliae]|uniref:Uncharacterized protein n=1 Tax=Legionella hackeliae TaxID=449 RepID=A0A0A8UQP7_LEGHA|nr:hypothetical protein [Legionella hackeliae]KTD15469.1 hypothetical protein Lhac_0311 [Legionella hackeliae]CEK11160.1 conserved exported protein of unknown function [Legionella hackeliae]STX47923.1 Uncharacterised protein [Legionella hackeliae]